MPVVTIMTMKSKPGGLESRILLPALSQCQACHPLPPIGLTGATSQGRVSSAKGCMAFSLSEIEVASLLDEVPVDLWCGHITVRSVNRFIDRKQLLLGHAHLVCLSFQFHLNASDRRVQVSHSPQANSPQGGRACFTH